MKIKIKLTPEAEDAIVAKSVKETYKRNNEDFWTKINKADCSEIREACRVLYHYYTGKILK